ncbi:MAG: hypothetical protein ACRDSJ_21115, partial [Rubrobacteraceae bacterium]
NHVKPLGAVGALLTFEFRLAVASLLGMAAVFVGILELSGRRVQLLQCNSETSPQWLDLGPLRWAIKNGLALGFGATSRIGFWLWYAVPAGSLLAGTPELGAIVYGTYGFARGMGAWGILLGHYTASFDVSDWLFEHMKTAKRLAAGQLVFLGVVIVIIMGI